MHPLCLTRVPCAATSCYMPPKFEYHKIDLSSATTKRSDVDVLNDAGRDGWELVSITANHIAYFKRAVPVPKAPARGRG